ncbi:hypothetical protein [Paucibacter sp. XJ19-41]|uniref:hypothetical protein n=1 Tax=Paucibacter sp. XJ19-41 TaxID=2927824 RepID=UPI002349B122|nr:hypothetical protein [Paucibacter sp. XJ19-41]MDC6169365.1 hypothetical protein [Paucibacter sp. XJ19-41]
MNPTLPESLDFLQGDPAPVWPEASPANAADLLPQTVADQLLQLDGVDGAWIERDGQGKPCVVLHYSYAGIPHHLPASVQGLPVRIVGGEPIYAGG